MRKYALAFDIYGTIIDTAGVYEEIVAQVGARASRFMDIWRNKQLEYSWRRGLMEKYVDFSVCTRDALDFTCLQLSENLSDAGRRDLLRAYQVLPAFSEVESCLTNLRESGYGIYALSNGSKKAVTHLLKHNQILEYFTQVVSAEDVRMFKPSPLVYRHFNLSTNTSKSDSWLISGNVFDVAGAAAYGMQTAWIRRKPDAIFDPGMDAPTLVTNDLSNLSSLLHAHT